jgi:hypothetical protein
MNDHRTIPREAVHHLGKKSKVAEVGGELRAVCKKIKTFLICKKANAF